MFAPFTARALRASILAAIATTGVAAAAPAAHAGELLTKLPINLSTQDSLRGQEVSEARSARIGGMTYFMANGGSATSELWKTDGTTAGTTLVKDFFPQSSGEIESITKAGSALVITTVEYNGMSSKRDVWTSDGTAAGTTKVAAPNGGTWNFISKTVATTTKAYVLAGVDDGNTRLYAIDAKTSTAAPADTREGAASDAAAVVAGDQVFYLHSTTLTSGSFLTKIGADGIPTDVLDGPGGDPLNLSGVYDLIAGGDGRIFWKINGGSVYATDGTPGAPTAIALGDTTLAAPIYAEHAVATPNGVAYPTNEYPSAFVTIDGTTATYADFGDGDSNVDGVPQVIGTHVYVSVNVEGVGSALHSTDLSNPATPATRIATAGGFAPEPVGGVASVAGHEYFFGRNADGFVVLYRIDAGVATAVKVFADNWADGVALTTVGDQLLFKLGSNAEGVEPWVSDGTAEGTHLLKDINDSEQDSDPGATVTFKDKAWFGAKDSGHGYELWNTDGTPGGTKRFTDVLAGPADSYARPLVAVGGKLLFSATDSSTGAHEYLYATDGTAEGTKPLFDTTAPAGRNPDSPVTLGSTVYFRGYSNLNTPATIWKTDGTPEGTTAVDLSALGGAPLSYVTRPVLSGGKVYIGTTTSGDAGAGLQLWVIDEAGTPKLLLNSSTLASFNRDELYATEGGVHFIAGDRYGNNPSLWKSDGTTAGTTEYATPDALAVAQSRTGFVKFGTGALYSRSGLGVSGLGILHADGTTSLVALPDGAYPTQTPVVGKDGKAYVTATVCTGTAATGRLKPSNCFDALFVVALDGTVTELKRFLRYSTGNVELRQSNGLVYVQGAIDGQGTQLFQTDGTVDGTTVVMDLTPGAGDSYAVFLGALGTTRLFAGSVANANQLFALTPEVVPTPTPTATPAATPDPTPAPAATPTPAPFRASAPAKIKPIDLRTIATNKGGGMFKVSGTIELPRVPAAATCEGTVRLVVKINHKPTTVATAELGLARKGKKGCTFSKTIKVQTRPGRTQRVRVIFDGTDQLEPIRGRSTALPR